MLQFELTAPQKKFLSVQSSVAYSLLFSILRLLCKFTYTKKTRLITDVNQDFFNFFVDKTLLTTIYTKPSRKCFSANMCLDAMSQ